MHDSAVTIAAWMLAGATAEVVGDEPLQGEPARYWVDDQEQAHLMPREAKSAPGVLLTKPDGDRMLYATVTIDAAHELLAGAALAYHEETQKARRL